MTIERICKRCEHWRPKQHGDRVDTGICERAATDVRSMSSASMAIECAHDGPIYTTDNFGCVLFEPGETHPSNDSSANLIGLIEGGIMVEDQEESIESLIWTDMLKLRNRLISARPEERGELSRRYAVTITEIEKAISYFHVMVYLDFTGEIHDE